MFLISVPSIQVVILGLCHLRTALRSKSNRAVDILGTILLADGAWSGASCKPNTALSGLGVGLDRLRGGSCDHVRVVAAPRLRTVAGPGRVPQPHGHRRGLLVVVAFFVLYGTIFFLTLPYSESGRIRVRGRGRCAAHDSSTGHRQYGHRQDRGHFGKPPLLVGIIAAGCLGGTFTAHCRQHVSQLWPWLILMGGGIGSISVASTDASSAASAS